MPPWDINKMLPAQIDSVAAFLTTYAQNEQGQTFTWKYSLYDDPDLERQLFYLRARMDITYFTLSKQIIADELPNNEVIGFIAADLLRMLGEAAYYASIGQLGPLSEVEAVIEPEPVTIELIVSVLTGAPMPVTIELIVTAPTLA